MIKSHYPAILVNNKDLSLGDVSLRFRHIDGLPNLLTIYELEKPLLQAYYELKNIVDDLENKHNSTYAIKGLFTLGVAHYEIMNSDFLLRFLKFFPEKLAVLRSKTGSSSDKKEFNLSQETINSENILASIINREVTKLAYSNINEISSSFFNILSISSKYFDSIIDKLVEIKETRNLLLHNNLVVNSIYLGNTKSYTRAIKGEESISIDKTYAVDSMKLILGLILDIIQKIRGKYGKYTLTELLSKLWSFTFKNEAIKIESFGTLNLQNDSVDGPFHKSNHLGFLSSSEQFFWDFWLAQRDQKMLKLNLTGLDKNNILKLSFLVEVFGEFRFPEWQEKF